MSRFIDAEELLEKIKEYPYGYRGMIESDIADMPTVDEYDVVAEYCRKRCLVIITADLFEKIKREYVGEEYWIR